MVFEVQNREKSLKGCFENVCFFRPRFFIDFCSILGGFWEGLGGLWEGLLALFSNILRHVNDFDENLDFGGILEGSGEAFGTVLRRFWEGFGRVWESLGRFWPL